MINIATISPGDELHVYRVRDLGPHPNGKPGARLGVTHHGECEVLRVLEDGRVTVKETGYGSMPHDIFTFRAESLWRPQSAWAPCPADCPGRMA